MKKVLSVSMLLLSLACAKRDNPCDLKNPSHVGVPVITNLSPVGTCPGGNVGVTISGRNFSQVNQVSIDGTPIGFSVKDSGRITITVPTHSQGGADVAVTNCIGTGHSTFYYVGLPTIDTVTPSSACQAGGGVLSISGTNFSPVTQVFVGGGPAPSYSTASATLLTAVLPSHGDGWADVSVANACGSAVSPSSVFYYGSPVIQGLSSLGDCVAGGRSVTITGQNFTGLTSVLFGGITSTSITSSSPTRIDTVTPAHSPGFVDVTVETSCGTGTDYSSFTYFSAPVVTQISPNLGCIAGGLNTNIGGSGLFEPSAVQFGGVNALQFTPVSVSLITATTPAGATGTVNVSVTGSCGTGTLASGFTYTASPILTSVTPNSGCVSGGTSVTITGSNLDYITQVTVGGKPALGFTIGSATLVTAVSPSSATVGSVDVVVYNLCGSYVSPNAFTYFAVGSPDPNMSITSVSPNWSCSFGGNSVLISGSNLTSTTYVTFGNILTTPTLVDLGGLLVTATAPQLSGGVFDVSAVSGTCGFTTLTAGFRYTEPPTVSSVSPPAGCTTGGQSRNVLGGWFSTTAGVLATYVAFGGTQALPITVASASLLTATTPPESAGLDNVYVVNACGVGICPFCYQYDNALSLSGISLTAGCSTGGQTLSLTGTKFTGGDSVNFGGALTPPTYSDPSGNFLTVSTPAHSPARVNVSVGNFCNTATLTQAYQYVNAPNIGSITPNVGCRNGGLAVNINGSSFSTTTDVKIDTTSTVFSILSDALITATTQAHSEGYANVSVSNLCSTVLAANAYFFYGYPVVNPVTKNSGTGIECFFAGCGCIANGCCTRVTIPGANFTGVTSVTFNGTNACTYVVNSPAQITAYTTVVPTGSLPVTVTTTCGPPGSCSCY